MPAPPKPAGLADFSVISSWPVQWGDQDAFGHVNNTVYFRWIESARIVYLEHIDLGETTSTKPLGPILAAISCNYRQQVTYPDTIYTGIRVTRLGRSSCTMEHRLWSERQQKVVADGEATIVLFDYGQQQSCAIPPEIRAAIARVEGRPVPGA
jgi:acyl-CoA thioester hydrolase